MTAEAPKQIAAILSRSEQVAAAYKATARVALELAFLVPAAANTSRGDIAEALSRFAAVVVPSVDTLPELTGLERRTLVLWGSRVLVEACYQSLPRGPVMFTLEAYLGGWIRRAFAQFVGEKVSAWLDAFIEVEVAKLRKAAA